ncbi:MAG: leucine-rich repeat protein, partial [Coriobacteriales bacterium]|nr:leucine-rich repeat protein [Coriobacteriales bacterium]
MPSKTLKVFLTICLLFTCFLPAAFATPDEESLFTLTQDEDTNSDFNANELEPFDLGSYEIEPFGSDTDTGADPLGIVPGVTMPSVSGGPERSELEVFSSSGLIETLNVPEECFVESPYALADSPLEFQVVPLLYNGPDSEKIVLTIMGDGFTASEQDYFVQSAKTVSDSVLGFFPFSAFKDCFNVYAIKVVSNASGAAYHPDQLIDNYFGSTFYYDRVTERLLYLTRSSRVYDVLRAYTPDYNMPVVLVNSTKFGGAGGAFSVISLEPTAQQGLVHELGHSAGGLLDEYWWAPNAAEAANMTQNNNPATNKWKTWLGYEGVGIYPHEESPNWFRPHQECQMRELQYPFCEVCAAELTRKMSSIIKEPFYGRDTLTTADIANGLTRIGDYTYYGCDNLTSVRIPKTVQSIGRYAFLRCTSLTSITNLSPIPQAIDNTTFAGVDRSKITLSVPPGAKTAYQLASWTGFKEIKEDAVEEETAALTNIAVTTSPSKTSYFQGETLSLAGLAITAYYSDSTNKTVTGYTTDPASGTALNNTGTKTVTVTYTEGGVTKTTSFTITVAASSGPAQKPNIITQPQSATVGKGTMHTLSVVAESPDGGTLSYQWYQYVDSDWKEITGATGSSYTLDCSVVGFCYYCVRITNTKGSTEDYLDSDMPLIKVTDDPFVAVTDITNVPASAKVGTPLTLTGMVSPSNATNKTITWTLKSAGTTGATLNGSTLNTTAAGTVTVTASVANGSSQSAPYTKDFNITVSTGSSSGPAQDPIIIVQPQDATVGTGSMHTLSVTAESPDGGTLSYQWHKSLGVFWEEIPGATGSTHTISCSTEGFFFYYVVVINTKSGVDGTTAKAIASDAATITVWNGYFVAVTDITNVPTATRVGVPLVLTGTIFPSAATNQTIVWTIKDAGNTGAALNGNTLNTSAPGTVTVTASVANGFAPNVAFAKDFSITINDIARMPKITAQPQDATVEVNTTHTLSVAAESMDEGTLSYQWNQYVDYSWTAIAGATGSSLVVDCSELGISQYNVEVTNTKTIASDTTTNMVTSGTATITVYAPAAPPAITAQPASAHVEIYTTHTLSVGAQSSDGGTLSYQWNHYSGTSWEPIGGATGSTLAVECNATGTSLFSVTVTNTKTSYGETTYALTTSDTATLTIVDYFEPVSDITGVATFTKTGTPLALSGVVVPSTATNQTITWTIKDAGTTGASLAANTLNTSAAGTVVVTATVADGFARGVPYAKDFSLAVYAPAAPPAITAQPASAHVEIYTTHTLSVAAQSTDEGTLSYQWYQFQSSSW